MTRNPIDDRSPEIVGSLADRASTLSANFTPGPWAYRPEAWDDWGTVRGGERVDGMMGLICTVRFPYYSEAELDEHRRNKTDPWEANARLIAASPDGYDAAVLALEHMEWSTTQGRAAYEALKAFVAKAGGQ